MKMYSRLKRRYLVSYKKQLEDDTEHKQNRAFAAVKRILIIYILIKAFIGVPGYMERNEDPEKWQESHT